MSCPHGHPRCPCRPMMADRPNPEPLARVLRSVGVEIGYAGADTYRTVVAERILADPGPLLAALAEAGVLRDRADAWDDGFDAGHQSARAINPEWPAQPANPYREDRTDG